VSDVHNRSIATGSDFDIEFDDDVHDRSMATISDFDCDDDQSVAELIEAAFADGEILEDTPVDATNRNQKDVIIIDGDDSAPRPSNVVLGKRKADPEPVYQEKAARPCFGEGSQRFPVELDSDDFDEEFDLEAFEEIHESAPQHINNTSGTEPQQVIEIASSSGSAAASSLSGSQGSSLTSTSPAQQLQRYQQLQEENLARQNAAGSQSLSRNGGNISLGLAPSQSQDLPSETDGRKGSRISLALTPSQSQDLPNETGGRKGSSISLGFTPSQSQDLPNESDGMIWGSTSLSSEAAQEPSQDVPSGNPSDTSSQYSDEDPPPPYRPGVEEDDPERPQMTPPDPTKTADGLTLSPEQLFVLDQVVTHNKSVFFTGSAGTGKSVLLRELIVRLREKYSRWVPPEDELHWDADGASHVAVTASTGIAACNIGGCTLHSFAGIGLGNEKVEVLIAKVCSTRKTVDRWRKARVLIVDEVSMVDAVLLDKLEAIARSVRKKKDVPCKPWGGLQVVLTGDFFQLPPVEKNGQARFCFEAASWKSTIHATIQLEQVFRQKDQSK